MFSKDSIRIFSIRFIRFASFGLLLLLYFFFHMHFQAHGQESSKSEAISPSVSTPILARSWTGTLESGVTRLKLGLHFTLNSEGTWKGTMDSPEQRAFNIPMDSVVLAGDRLRFEIRSVRAKFDGIVSTNPTRIQGSWTQGTNIQVVLHVDEKSQPAKAVVMDSFSGTWNGHIELEKTKLAMVLHLSQDDDGKWRGALDSPEQGAMGIPVDLASVNGKEIYCEIKSAGASIKATLSEDSQTIEGMWVQGEKYSFRLHRSSVPKIVLHRPQTPRAPFPYRTEDITFENKTAKIRLAGTLTLPDGTGPHPAIVLISGSGAHNRDEEMNEHKVFFVIADYLTRKGVAVLRYDDRGTGESTGAFSGTTTLDFADDAISAVEYLSGRSDILVEQIGLLGHSEGGIVAPIAEVKSGKVAFVVLLAGPGVDGEQLLYEQSRRIIASNGGSEEVIEENRLVQEELFRIVATESNASIAETKLKQLSETKAAQHKENGWSNQKIEEWNSAFQADCTRVNSPWFRMFLTLDPADWLRRVRAPILVINGDRDTQVVPDQNLPAIENALKLGGHSSYVIKRLPQLNHQLQTCKTGSPEEYREIEETIAPIALEAVAEWVLKTIESKNTQR